jgi:hypothetical protein
MVVTTSLDRFGSAENTPELGHLVWRGQVARLHAESSGECPHAPKGRCCRAGLEASQGDRMQAGPVRELALGEKAVDAEPPEGLGERHHVSFMRLLTLCYQKAIITL